VARIIGVDLPEALFQELPIHRPRQRRQRMLHVDDLIEPRAKQILLSRLAPFSWLHPLPRQSIQRRVNHKSNLQGIPFRRPDSRQTRLPLRAVSRFQINDLRILHGRRNIFARGTGQIFGDLPVGSIGRTRRSASVIVMEPKQSTAALAAARIASAFAR
jgi:hypothetical protein